MHKQETNICLSDQKQTNNQGAHLYLETSKLLEETSKEHKAYESNVEAHS